MALLGKTLKGRSTKPGAETSQKNYRMRQIAKTQEDFDQQQKENKEKKMILKQKLLDEQNIIKFNKKKLLTYWRRILRVSKAEQLKSDIDVIAQNNLRELDSKEAFIQMLDKNLDESEEQYQIALRNHLIHLQHFIALQENRIEGLKEEFLKDVTILQAEFDKERQLMLKNQKKKQNELDDMVETVKDDDKKKTLEALTSHQTEREQTRNQKNEDIGHMKMLLEAKQNKYYNDLEQLHQKYQSETAKKTEEHTDLYNKNRDMSRKIEQLVRNIANKKAKMALMRLKIIQHKKDCQIRNQGLRKEKENIGKDYSELKAKMMKFREEEQKRLQELVTNSRNAVKKITEYNELGERILQTAELCRKVETEKEKVLPFYEGSVDSDTEIPEDLKKVFEEISPEQYQEFSFLNQFYKRYNKVLLDKLAIIKQKESLEKDNVLLKSLLKQYLDGISLNDDVLKNNNPLFVVNNKIDISKPPVDKVEHKTTVEAAFQIKNIQLQGASNQIAIFNNRQ